MTYSQCWNRVWAGLTTKIYKFDYIDNQLRGRSGRQGDKGESQFGR